MEKQPASCPPEGAPHDHKQLPQLETGKRHHKQVQKRWLGPKIVYFLLKSFLPKEEYMHSSRDSPVDKSRFLVKRSSALNTKETFLGKQEIKTFLQRIKNFWFTFNWHFSFCKSTSWYSFHPVSSLWTTPSATAEPQGLTDYSASCVLSERTEVASSGLAPKHLLSTLVNRKGPQKKGRKKEEVTICKVLNSLSGMHLTEQKHTQAVSGWPKPLPHLSTEILIRLRLRCPLTAYKCADQASHHQCTQVLSLSCIHHQHLWAHI